jgi:long-chain fatty acid transport protein
VKRALLVLLVLGGAAHAGGLERPNQISARGVGLGGAFTGIADDGSAWYFNPAGAAFADDTLMIGGEFVYAPRSFTPVDASGTRGATQSATAASPVPSLGLVIHPSSDGVPSRLALGAGVWNSFGGAISFPKMADANVPAINASTDLVIEVAAGAAYEVDDVFSVGAAVRMGIGAFSVDATSHPIPQANLSSMGVGIGATAGIMLRPIKPLSVGLTWRSGMNISTQGSGTADFTLNTPSTVNVQQVQHWPQQIALGAALKAGAVRLAAQLDWTQWSRFDQLLIEFPDQPLNDQTFDLSWHDNYAVRGGVEVETGFGAVRAGAYYDTSAVPDRTIERQYLDSNKIGVAAGGSGAFGGWRVDGAIDFTLPGTRTVRDNRGDYTFPGGTWSFANTAPGDYHGYVVTVELALAHRL